MIWPLVHFYIPYFYFSTTSSLAARKTRDHSRRNASPIFPPTKTLHFERLFSINSLLFPASMLCLYMYFWIYMWRDYWLLSWSCFEQLLPKIVNRMTSTRQFEEWGKTQNVVVVCRHNTSGDLSNAFQLHTASIYSELWALQDVGTGMMWFLLVSDKSLSQVILGLSLGFLPQKKGSSIFNGWFN